MRISSTVIVSHRVVGFHHWSGAPDEVAYLRNLHRHLFLFLVAWPVHHDNRQIEFHTAQAWIKKLYDEPMHFGASSCEMLAHQLYDGLRNAGHPAPCWIEVWEDQENGARVEFDPA
jgi:hypothetical protein